MAAMSSPRQPRGPTVAWMRALGVGHAMRQRHQPRLLMLHAWAAQMRAVHAPPCAARARRQRCPRVARRQLRPPRRHRPRRNPRRPNARAAAGRAEALSLIHI